MACTNCGGKTAVRLISEHTFDMNSTARLTVNRYISPFTVTIPASVAVDSQTPRTFIIDQESFELPTPAARWLYDNYPGAYEIEEFNTIEIEPMEIYNPDALTSEFEDPGLLEMFDNKQPEPVVSVGSEPVVDSFVSQQPEPVVNVLAVESKPNSVNVVPITVKKGRK